MITKDAKALVGSVLGNYSITDLIDDQGGYSFVFAGRSLKSGRPVALKIMKDGIASQYQFLEEAQKCIKLRHENIVELIEYFPSEHGLCLVYELLVGSTLHKYIEQNSSLGRADCISIFRQVLAAVRAVHRAGYVHRDIKPANIFLTENGVVKLMDFGITKPMPKKTMTVALLLTGTPGYIAPELYEGASAKIESDVFSLGVVLKDLLTWKPGQGSVTFKELMKVDSLWYVVWRCTMKDPKRRPDSVDAIEAILPTENRVPFTAKPIVPITAAVICSFSFLFLIWNLFSKTDSGAARLLVKVNPGQTVEVMDENGGLVKSETAASTNLVSVDVEIGQRITVHVLGRDSEGEAAQWSVQRVAEEGTNEVEVPSVLPDRPFGAEAE